MEPSSEIASVLEDLRLLTAKIRGLEARREQLIRDADQLGASTRAIATAAGVAHTTIIRALRSSAA